MDATFNSSIYTQLLFSMKLVSNAVACRAFSAKSHNTNLFVLKLIRYQSFKNVPATVFQRTEPFTAEFFFDVIPGYVAFHEFS